MEILDLTDKQPKSVLVKVSREAGFDNTVDFYQVEADGSVIDPSGRAIAPEESGYIEAAIANRLELNLSAENGETSESTVDFPDSGLYAPLIAVESDFELFADNDPSNDPTVYTTYEVANEDGFDHVTMLGENEFGFEDLPNGGDKDFNDVIVDFNSGEAGTEPADPTEPVVPEAEPMPDGIIQGQNLVIDDAGTVGSVDLATGEFTELLSSNIRWTDIDVDGSGNVYGITNSELYALDLETQSTTLIGSHGIDGLNALEIGENGIFYAASIEEREIYVLDSSSGTASSIGTLPEGVNSAGDLQFIGDTLYLADDEDLVSIDVEGESLNDSSVVGSFNLEDEQILGITVDEDGDPVGLSDNGSILELNLDTGETTQIATVENNTTIFGAAALPNDFFNGEPATNPNSADPADPVDTTDPTNLGTISGVKFDDLNGSTIRDSELVQGDNPDVVFVIDSSGSTDDAQFAGEINVGDLNNDGRENDVIDAEIAGFTALNQQLIDQGLGDSVDVGIVAFAANAAQLDLDPATDGVQLSTTPNVDNDGNGISDVVDALTPLRSDGDTNFEAALQDAEDTFESLGTEPGDGNLIFISDGFPEPDVVNYDDEVARLNDRGVNLSAFGAGEGSRQDRLQIIDPDARIFTSTDEILSVFDNLDSGTGGSGEVDGGGSQSVLEPGIEGVNIYLDLNNNGELDTDEPVRVTDADGQYSFTDLEPGSYIVREVVPAGFTQTAPIDGQLTVDLVAGETVADQNFGNIAAEPVI